MPAMMGSWRAPDLYSVSVFPDNLHAVRSVSEKQVRDYCRPDRGTQRKLLPLFLASFNIGRHSLAGNQQQRAARRGNNEIFHEAFLA